MIDQLSLWTQEPWAKAALVMFTALILALFVQIVVSRVLLKLVSKTKTEIDDRLVGDFKMPVFVSILAAGFWNGLKFFNLAVNVGNLVYAVLATLVIILWMLAALKFTNFLVNWLSSLEDRFQMVQPRTQPVFHILLKIVIITVAVYFVIHAWNGDVTGWLASAGVAGVAIGFAAKDTLANFFSGIFIIADAPYKIGDYVVLGNGDRGRVTHIGIRSTRLLTRDDVEVIIPNAIIGNSEIINQSGGPSEGFRLRVKVGVAYGSDIDQVREILLEIAASEPLVESEPTPRVRLREFGDSSLNFELLVWVALPELKGKALDSLLSRVYKVFAAENVEIPYPKRDVYIHHIPAPKEE